jgi:hypothetical protein
MRSSLCITVLSSIELSSFYISLFQQCSLASDRHLVGFQSQSWVLLQGRHKQHWHQRENGQPIRPRGRYSSRLAQSCLEYTQIDSQDEEVEQYDFGMRLVTDGRPQRHRLVILALAFALTSVNAHAVFYTYPVCCIPKR